MKRLLKIGLSLVALATAGIIAFFCYFDAIVGAAVETGCTKALGVGTRVGWVRIGLLTGEVKIGRLRIDNPPGFETDHFFAVDRIQFDVQPGALMQDTIVVPLLEIDGTVVSLETVDGKRNYDAILANLERFSSSGSAEPVGGKAVVEDDGREKGFVLREAVIRDIDATIDLGKVAGGSDRVRVEIPEIRLHPSESTGSAEASVAELTQVVVTAVLTGIANKAPTALAKGLVKGLGGLEAVTLEIPDAVTEVGSSVVGGVKTLGERAKKLGSGAGSAVKGLDGLFGGSDEEQ